MNKFLYQLGDLLIAFSRQLVAWADCLRMPYQAELTVKCNNRVEQAILNETKELLDRCEARAARIADRQVKFKIVENGQTKSVQQFLLENQSDYESIFGKQYVSR